jgi:hypothetical protein
MKKIFFSFLFISAISFSQQMTVEKLNTIISLEADSLKVTGNSWRFKYKDRLLICIADKKANRMRIISPIAERKQLTDELILNSLVANFHTALDVKYALSDEILWSVFTHPLKELSKHQVEDAISQVYYANKTFGTIFTSTTLNFPGNTKKKEFKKIVPIQEKI